VTHTAEDIARVRAELRARQEARTRERILGLRHSHRTMPVKEIAYRVGVSREEAQAALAETDPPQGIPW